jgi:hypothetical protein
MIFFFKYCFWGVLTMVFIEILGKQFLPTSDFNVFNRVVGVLIFPLLIVVFILSFLFFFIKQILKNK